MQSKIAHQVLRSWKALDVFNFNHNSGCAIGSYPLNAGQQGYLRSFTDMLQKCLVFVNQLLLFKDLFGKAFNQKRSGFIAPGGYAVLSFGNEAFGFIDVYMIDFTELFGL